MDNILAVSGRVAIHQPNLFPRLKVLHKIASSDLWVLLDDVQFVSREWQNRARLRYLKQPSHNFWLTVPVIRPNGRASLLNSITIYNAKSNTNQIKKTIWHAYRGSQYWQWIDNYVERVLDVSSDALVEMAALSMSECLSSLNITKPVVKASTLSISAKQTTRLVHICKAINARAYLSGSGGRNYLNEEEFLTAGIAISWQKWSVPQICADRMNGFEWRNVSFLDFVARFGPGALEEHLTKCGGFTDGATG